MRNSNLKIQSAKPQLKTLKLFIPHPRSLAKGMQGGGSFNL